MALRLTLIVAFLLTVPAVAQLTAADNPAQTADMRWLQLIDGGDYAEAWNSAAPAMRNAVGEPAFAQSIAAARTPLGAPGTRTLIQIQAKTSLPGAPDGHYLIAQYATAFANKAQAVETVVAAQDPEGSWHVTGYFIR